MFTRALIFLLVMLNLGVALWWITRGDADGQAAGSELPAGVARLQLAAEAMPDGPSEVPQPAPDVAPETDPGTAPAPGSEAVAESATPVPAAPAASRCHALGPFADAAAAATARAALPAGVAALRVREATPANAPWRVVMPPLPDRDAATAMAQRLREAGFADLFVVAEGGEANGIALGRFGGQTAARNHAAALRQAGFDVRAEPVPGSTRYWLEVRADAGVDPASLRRATGAAQADVVECPAAG